MPDLLSHVLIAYTAALVLSWWFGWLTPSYRTVAMVGACIPDMTKITLILRDEYVEAFLGVPFSWKALHTTGGVIVAILIGVTLVAPEERTRVGVLLGLGAVTHLLADALLVTPSGRSYAILWPLTQYHPPTPGLFTSTQPQPTVLVGLVAATVWVATQYRATG